MNHPFWGFWKHPHAQMVGSVQQVHCFKQGKETPGMYPQPTNWWVPFLKHEEYDFCIPPIICWGFVFASLALGGCFFIINHMKSFFSLRTLVCHMEVLGVFFWILLVKMNGSKVLEVCCNSLHISKRGCLLSTAQAFEKRGKSNSRKYRLILLHSLAMAVKTPQWNEGLNSLEPHPPP